MLITLFTFYHGAKLAMHDSPKYPLPTLLITINKTINKSKNYKYEAR